MPAAVVSNYRDLIDVWLSLAARYPGTMAAAHASARAVVPAAVCDGHASRASGFLHSTILPNDFGLAVGSFPRWRRARATWSGRGMRWDSSWPTPPCS